jgi:hypothetical protein
MWFLDFTNSSYVILLDATYIGRGIHASMLLFFFYFIRVNVRLARQIRSVFIPYYLSLPLIKLVFARFIRSAHPILILYIIVSVSICFYIPFSIIYKFVGLEVSLWIYTLPYFDQNCWRILFSLFIFEPYQNSSKIVENLLCANYSDFYLSWLR